MGETRLNAAILLGTDHLIEELGGDPCALAREAGLDPRAFSDPNRFIDGEAFVDFLELAASRCDCADFGTRYGLRWPAVALGPLWLAVGSAETLGDAVASFTRSYRVFGDAAILSSEPIDAGLWVRFEPLATGRWGAGQWVDACFAFLVKLVRSHGPADWTPGLLRLRHVAPASRLYRRTFGAHVAECQSENTMLLDRELLGVPLNARGLALAGADVTLAPRGAEMTSRAIRRQAEMLVRTLLPLPDCSLVTVARTMSLSKRTLQRRLAESGACFEKIVDESRAKLAWLYVTQTSLRMYHIAEMVGFSEQTAFSHAFRRWHGLSPREARRSERIGEEADQVRSTDPYGRS